MRVPPALALALVMVAAGDAPPAFAQTPANDDGWLSLLDGQWSMFPASNFPRGYEANGRHITIHGFDQREWAVSAFGAPASDSTQVVADREASVRCRTSARSTAVPTTDGMDVYAFECDPRGTGAVDAAHSAWRFVVFRHPDGSYLVADAEADERTIEPIVGRIRAGARRLRFGTNGLDLHVCGGHYALDLPDGSFATGTHDAVTWAMRIAVGPRAWLDGELTVRSIDVSEWRRLRAFHANGDPPTAAARFGATRILLSVPERGRDARVDTLRVPIVLECASGAPNERLAAIDMAFGDAWGASRADLLRGVRSSLASARWRGPGPAPRIRSLIDAHSVPEGRVPRSGVAIAVLVLLVLAVAFADERDAL